MARKKNQPVEQVVEQEEKVVDQAVEQPVVEQDEPKGDPIGKSYLVVGGFPKKPIDGHYPHVSAYRIARAKGLNLKDCHLADERETERVTKLTKQVTKVFTVEDL